MPDKTSYGAEDSFLKIATSLLQQQSKACPICTHKDRALIEEFRKKGAPFTIIGTALMRMGVYQSCTPKTAADRVSAHFSSHPKMNEDLTK